MNSTRARGWSAPSDIVTASAQGAHLFSNHKKGRSSANRRSPSSTERMGRVAPPSTPSSPVLRGPARKADGPRGFLESLPKRRVLREDIRDRLVEEILGGHLVAGDRLVETRIAQNYGVSQAPVREALRDLELRGFIVSAPFRGSVVRGVSTSDLVHIYRLRAVLEGLAARRAATRIDAPRLKRLEHLVASMRKSAARGDTRGAVAFDFAFRLTIVETSGNGLLKELWESTRLTATTVLNVPRLHHWFAEIAERHTAVVDALRVRACEDAERSMRRHMEQRGERHLQDMEEARKVRPASKRRKSAVKFCGSR